MIKLCMAVALMACVGAGPARSADRLSGLLWKRRVVVVFADTHEDARFGRQVASLDERSALLADYDTTVVTVPDGDVALRQRLGVLPHGFAVALVGKDGTVKERWRAPVMPERIFGIIDRMSMRRDEVRARK